jgi:hypothetical protein
MEESTFSAASSAERTALVYGMCQLAAHIRSVYQANADARSTITDSLRRAKLASEQQYDSELIKKIERGIGGSLTYYPIIRIKAESAAAWIQKILTTADKPWSLTPTPDPDLDDTTIQQIAAAAMMEGQRVQALSLRMSPEDYYDFAQDMRTLIMQQRNSRASDAAAKAEVLIADKLAEGHFDKAFSEFIVDFCLFPTAFLRSKVTLDKVSKVEMIGDDPDQPTFAKIEKISECRTFERIAPVRVFPSAGQVGIDDDDVVIVTLMSLKEIADMAEIPGFNRQEIKSLIADCSTMQGDYLHDPLDVFPEAKLYAQDTDKYRRASRLAALEYYGTVKGSLLKEWCAAEPLAIEREKEERQGIEDGGWSIDPSTGRSVRDGAGQEESPEITPDMLSNCGIPADQLEDDRFYSVYAITIHDRCIYCRITDDEPRWIYAASFKSNPDSIWGTGIADMLKHIQADANAVRRATMNNLNLASYPQIIVNQDSLNQMAPGSKPGLMPGKVWYTRPTFSGITKPVDFFTIPTIYPHLNNEFQQLLVMADRVSGIPEYSQGLASGAKNGAAGTASGLSMLLEAAGNQIKAPIDNIDTGLLEPLVRSLYYELLNDPEAPGEAKGDFKIVALGANGLIFKEQVTQKRREFLQLVLASPVLQSIIKPEGVNALIRDVADGLGMETDDLVPTKAEMLEQLAFAQQQQMVQQQMMMSANGGGAPMPPEQAAPDMATAPNGQTLPVQPPQGV